MATSSSTSGKNTVIKNVTGGVKIENHVFSGAIWFSGWLFTIGFLDLNFWRAVWSLIVWPYYLGLYFSNLF